MPDWTNYITRENNHAVFQQEPQPPFCGQCGKARHYGPCVIEVVAKKERWTNFQIVSVTVVGCLMLMGIISAAFNGSNGAPTNAPTPPPMSEPAKPVKPAMSPQAAVMDQRIRSIVTRTNGLLDQGDAIL